MKYVVLDIESTGLNRFKDEINFIGVYYPQDKKTFVFSMPTDKDQFIRLMTKTLEKKYHFVWQNGKFDTLFIEHKLGILLPIHEDTMVLGTAYDLAAQHGLKTMAMEYLGVSDWDIGKKEKTSTDRTVVEPYLLKDLKYTWRIFNHIIQRIKEKELKIYRKLLLPAYKMFRDTERYGIYLDIEACKILKTKYEKKRKQLTSKLNELTGGQDINWKSPKQVSEYLFDELKLPAYKLTKTGNPSTDAETLKRLKMKTQHPVVVTLLEYKEYDGALTKFLNRWPKDAVNSRIHPSFGLTNVVTGRTSCSSPNLQQVPRKRELRNLFTAPPEKVLLNFDYSQIELRIAAHYSQDKTMLDIYRTGGDIHTKTAQTLIGAISPTKEQRTAAKAVSRSLAA